MRFRVKVKPSGDNLDCEFTEQAFRLFLNSYLCARQRVHGSESQEFLFGVDLAMVDEFVTRIEEKEFGVSKRYYVRATGREMHGILSLLLVVRDILTTSEEDFNIQTGFFRQHAIEMIQGLRDSMEISLERVSLGELLVLIRNLLVDRRVWLVWAMI